MATTSRITLSLPRTQRFARSHCLVALLAVVSGLLVLATLREPLIIYDEGIVVVGAWRVMHGDIPYRDFWTIYAPGQFYLLAALFRLVGPSLLAERLVDRAVRVLIVVLVYRFVARLTSPLVALAPSLIVTLWLAAAGNSGYAMFPALALALAGKLTLSRRREHPSAGWLLLAGWWSGLAALFRHDLGGYALLTGVVVLTLHPCREMEPDGAPGPRRWARRTRRAGPFVLGFAAAVLPAALYLALAVPPTDLWTNLVAFPLTTLHAVRGRPYPALVQSPLPLLSGEQSLTGYLDGIILSWVRFYAPLAVYATAAGVLVARRRTRGADPAELSARWGAGILLAFGVVSFAQGLHRFDNVHLIPTDICALMLASILLAKCRIGPRPRLALLVGPMLVLLALSYLWVPARTYVATVRSAPPLPCRADLARAACARVADDQARAVAYVRQMTGSEEPLFVGDTGHDRVFASDVAFYFLADRPSATKYHELHPGVATRTPVQQQIVAELERGRVRYVVLFSAFDEVVEENASAVSSGVRVLDTYLDRTYQPVARFGDYTVLRRRGL